MHRNLPATLSTSGATHDGQLPSATGAAHSITSNRPSSRPPIPSMASQPGERSGRCRGRILGAHGVGQSQCQHTLDAKPFQMKDALRRIQCRAGLGQSPRAVRRRAGRPLQSGIAHLFQQGKAGGRGIRSVGQSRNLRGDPPAASTGHQHAARARPDGADGRTHPAGRRVPVSSCATFTQQREQRDAGTLRDAPHVTDERRIMPGRTAKRCRGGRLHQDEIEAALRLLGQESARLDTRCPDVGAGAGGGDGVEQQHSITRIRGDHVMARSGRSDSKARAVASCTCPISRALVA